MAWLQNWNLIRYNCVLTAADLKKKNLVKACIICLPVKQILGPTYSNEKKIATEACLVRIRDLSEVVSKIQSIAKRKTMKEMILTCDRVGTEGVVSMYSTRFWASQCSVLIRRSAVTIARNVTEKSCLK